MDCNGIDIAVDGGGLYFMLGAPQGFESRPIDVDRFYQAHWRR